MSKNGFSYYKAETDRFQDIKIKRLKKKYGCDGYAVYQYALNEIYRVDGSYIRWTEDQLFDCADYWGMNEERVKEIVDYCAEICLFDPVVWKMKCILTSRAIQSRYIDICKLAKKKMYIPLDILLVEPEQPIKEPVSMPLFETATAAEPTGQNAPDVSMSPTTVELSRNFRKISRTFRKLPETFRKKSTKKRKAKKKKTKKSPPLSPYRLSENSRRRKRNICFLPPRWGEINLKLPLQQVAILLPQLPGNARHKWRRWRANKSHVIPKG